MNHLSRLFAVLLSLLAIPAFAVTVPVLSNPVGTGQTGGNANLSVTVATNGANTNVVFNYGLTNAYGSTAMTPVTDSAQSQTATVALTGLVPGMVYHFQVTASNSAGNATPTADQTFKEPPFAVTGSAKPISTTARLNGTVTANGLAGNAFFEFGLTNAYGMTTSTVPVAATANNVSVQGQATGLTRNVTYHYRVVFAESGGITVNGDDATFITNNAPIANTDTINAAGSGATTINPLVNDRDPDGAADGPMLVDVDTQPTHGKAVVNGSSIIYTPDAGSEGGFDTFTYTIKDVYGLTATGTINIRAVRAAFSGTHGGFIKRANGKEAGYFTVTATKLGTFTGIAIIDGKRFVVTGTISPDGVYRGYATEGASAIPVFIFTDQMDNGSSVTALFDNGRWTSELTLSPEDRTTRAQAFGRYTTEISTGSSLAKEGNDPGTPPGGSGWGALRVGDDGTATIKGRLPDGRPFSTRGTVNIEDGAAVFTFYDDPEGSRVIGKLTLTDSLSGTVETDRQSSGEGRFPRGYDISSSASGARYMKPPDKRRILDTTAGVKGQDLTISFEGEGLPGTISRLLFLDDHDHVTVVDRGAEELKMKIDRNSGRWQAKITIDTAGTRIKATGVLIQSPEGGSGRGIGSFNTSRNSGTVTITPAGSGGTGSGGGTTTTPP